MYSHEDSKCQFMLIFNLEEKKTSHLVIFWSHPVSELSYDDKDNYDKNWYETRNVLNLFHYKMYYLSNNKNGKVDNELFFFFILLLEKEKEEKKAQSETHTHINRYTWTSQHSSHYTDNYVHSTLLTTS